MHHISKNWEGIFEFQYEVAIGQCDRTWGHWFSSLHTRSTVCISKSNTWRQKPFPIPVKTIQKSCTDFKNVENFKILWLVFEKNKFWHYLAILAFSTLIVLVTPVIKAQLSSQLSKFFKTTEWQTSCYQLGVTNLVYQMLQKWSNFAQNSWFG